VRERGAYGLQLCISFDHDGETRYAFYAHLFKVYVKEGDLVVGNDLVAASGESGNAKGMPVADQHLHLEIRTALKPRSGLQDRISPLKVFGKCPLYQPIPG
jgi:murein DD-endopeptidase MepM/ murein hydrolase activator NlpD